MQILLFLSIVTLIPLAYQATTSSGSVELDELSFDKITGKFEAALIKFDVAFPYGDKHDAYVALAKDAKDVDDLLIGEVGVKDYGEKDNEELARKYGATKDNFPVVKLFVRGRDEPIPFDDSKGFTSDELRRFVRENTGLYLSLPGCVKDLDKLANKFMKSKGDDRKKILKETEQAIKGLNKKDGSSGKTYKTIMEKVLDKDNKFVTSEIERVQKLLSGKVSDNKKKELEIRLNILQSFQLVDMKKREIKEDL